MLKLALRWYSHSAGGGSSFVSRLTAFGRDQDFELEEIRLVNNAITVAVYDPVQFFPVFMRNPWNGMDFLRHVL